MWDQRPTIPPSQRAIGRVALALAQDGIELIFGCTSTTEGLGGWKVSGDQWVSVPISPVDALYDRFPDQSQPDVFAELCAHLPQTPIFNAPAFTKICRDKVALQRFLRDASIPMPEMVSAREQFEDALSTWGGAFLKPKFGSLGRGVHFVDSIEALNHALNVESDQYGPYLLQRAIPPLDGWKGVCVRVLLQRDMEGSWVANPGAARCSATDPVVNAARGANVVAARDYLSMVGRKQLQECLMGVGRAFDRHPNRVSILEMGIDFVVDRHGCPHLIEINGKPKGRLAWLAQQQPDAFQAAHTAAMMRPFQCIARVLKATRCAESRFSDTPQTDILT